MDLRSILASQYEGPMDLLLKSMQSPSRPMTAEDIGIAQRATNTYGDLTSVSTARLSDSERAWVDASHAAGDERMNRLLQDPAFRASAGLRPIESAPLATPNQGIAWSKGQSSTPGDTRGGVERVNANSATYGVTASRDPVTGQVTLTNIQADGTPTPQSQPGYVPGSGFNPMDKETGNNIDSLLDQISKASDSATAEGIARSLRTALAEESTRLQNEAYNFVRKEIGIEALEQQLAESESKDRAAAIATGNPAPSQETVGLRSKIETLSRTIPTKVNEYLGRNIRYSRLKAASESADSLVKLKVEKLAQQEKEQAIKRFTYEEKEKQEQEQAKISYENIPEQQRELIKRINPNLRGEGKEREFMRYVSQQIKSNKAFEEFVIAPKAQHLNLALNGNPLALRTIAEDEAAATGRSTEEVEAEIVSLSQSKPSEGMVDAWINQRLAALPEADRVKERQALKSQYNQMLMAPTKEDKAKLAEVQRQILVSNYKVTKTRRLLSDVSAWNSPDPEIQAAVEAARNTTGSASVDKVLTAYLGDAEGPEAFERIANFKRALLNATQKEKKSILGGVDEAALLNAINNTIIQQGSLTNKIAKFWGQAPATNINTEKPVVNSLFRDVFGL